MSKTSKPLPSRQTAGPGEAAPASGLWADAREDLARTRAFFAGVRPESWIVLALVIGLFWFWQDVSGHHAEAILPSPGETAEAFFKMLQDYRADYAKAIGSTMQVYYIGLGLALISGWGLAVLMGLIPLFGRVMTVVLDFFGTIPAIAFMPLIVALLGLGPAAKIVVVFIAALIVITTTAHAAFLGAGRQAEEAAMVLGASRLQAHLRVVWPQILPQMVAGLRVGAAQALSACIIAEIYTAMTRPWRAGRRLWRCVQHAALFRHRFDHCAARQRHRRRAAPFRTTPCRAVIYCLRLEFLP